MSSNHWTHQEKNQLQHLVVTVKQPIADIRVGRHNQSSIRRQATRLGYLTTRPAHIDWSRRQKQELRILNKAGYSCSQIINYNLLLNPPRSAWAIRNQWRRCKLSDRKVSRRQSQKKSWQPGEKLLFDEYLYQHSRTQTPEQITLHGQVCQTTVTVRQNELGLKLTRQQVMQLPYSLAKQKRGMERIKRKNKKRFRQKRQQFLDHLNLKADVFRQNGYADPTKNRTCAVCQTNWPTHRTFFPTMDKKITLGNSKAISRYLKRKCRLCERDRINTYNKKHRRQKRSVQ